MKTLYLVRHAKSDWSIENLQDIDRPLSARGYLNAHQMSIILKEKKFLPDLIISSHAIRAISTALIFSRNLDCNPSMIAIKKSLYESSVKDYINCISSISEDCGSIMIFGHNPIITDCANSLTKSFTEEIPTTGIVGIQSKAPKWKSILDQLNELIYFDFPKNHPNE